jgi:hypothetical protein
MGERAVIRTCSLHHSIIGLARSLFIFPGVVKAFAGNIADGLWISLFLDNAHVISLDPELSFLVY